jgi:hypothetical protein
LKAVNQVNQAAELFFGTPKLNPKYNSLTRESTLTSKGDAPLIFQPWMSQKRTIRVKFESARAELAYDFLANYKSDEPREDDQRNIYEHKQTFEHGKVFLCKATSETVFGQGPVLVTVFDPTAKWYIQNQSLTQSVRLEKAVDTLTPSFDDCFHLWNKVQELLVRSPDLPPGQVQNMAKACSTAWMSVVQGEFDKVDPSTLFNKDENRQYRRVLIGFDSMATLALQEDFRADLVMAFAPVCLGQGFYTQKRASNPKTEGLYMLRDRYAATDPMQRMEVECYIVQGDQPTLFADPFSVAWPFDAVYLADPAIAGTIFGHNLEAFSFFSQKNK